MTEDDRTDTKSQGDGRVEPMLGRCLLWMVASLAIAFVVGLMFSVVPARFRLLGLLTVAQGCAVGLLAGRVALPLKMHSRSVGMAGGFSVGVVSVLVTATLLWRVWSVEMLVPSDPDPNVALASQMLAQMAKPDGDDPEKLKAYNETVQQLQGFIDSEVAPPGVGVTDWLTHRASALSVSRNVAVALGLIELVLAGLASAWQVKLSVTVPFCWTCQNWRRVIRSHRFTAPLPVQLSAMIPEADRERVTSTTVEFSTCGCEARPSVFLGVETSDQTSNQQTDLGEEQFDLSEEQFRELKQLLDEAQGMK